MLKVVGKFEDLIIVNLNLFVTTMFNDFKSHVKLFIILDGVVSLTEGNF
jgi:hypothetical protein